MKSRHRFAVVLPAVLALLAWGCPITLNVPINRFDSPEARGRSGKIHADVGLQGSSEDIVVPDYTAEPPVTNTRSFGDSAGSIRAAVGMGLTRQLDVDFRLALPGPGTLQLKYQLLGAPELEAKRGNTSVAVTAGLGDGRSEGGMSMGGNGDSITYDHRATHYDVAAIFGERLLDPVLLYGGPFYTLVRYDGAIDQTKRPGGGRYPYSGNVNQSGANLGLQLGDGKGLLKLEGAWTRATDAPARRSGLRLGAVLAYHW